MFSGYNRGVDDFAAHILVYTARPQAFPGLLGRLFGLPATLSGCAALACAGKSLRWRLSPPSSSLFHPSASKTAEGTHMQPIFEKRMNMATQTISNAGPKIRTKL